MFPNTFKPAGVLKKKEKVGTGAAFVNLISRHWMESAFVNG